MHKDQTSRVSAEHHTRLVAYGCFLIMKAFNKAWAQDSGASILLDQFIDLI